MDAKNRNSVIVFLALTFAISAIFYTRSFSGASLSSVVPFLMCTPGLCAIVTQLVFNRTIAGLGWGAGPWRYLGLAILLPFVYCLAIYVPVWVVGAGRFEGRFLATAFPVLPLALAQNVVLALGEEIGWRGLLVPALYRGIAAAFGRKGSG